MTRLASRYCKTFPSVCAGGEMSVLQSFGRFMRSPIRRGNAGGDEAMIATKMAIAANPSERNRADSGGVSSVLTMPPGGHFQQPRPAFAVAFQPPPACRACPSIHNESATMSRAATAAHGQSEHRSDGLREDVEL